MLSCLSVAAAAAVPFVPFVNDVVPFVLLFRGAEWSEWFIRMLAAPCLLGLPLIVSEIREALGRPVTPWESRASLVAAALIAGCTASTWIALLRYLDLTGDLSPVNWFCLCLGLAGFFAVPGAALACSVLIWRRRRRLRTIAPTVARIEFASYFLYSVSLFCEVPYRAVGWYCALVAAAGTAAAAVREAMTLRARVAVPAPGFPGEVA